MILNPAQPISTQPLTDKKENLTTLPSKSEMLVNRLVAGTKTVFTNNNRNQLHNIQLINRESNINVPKGVDYNIIRNQLISETVSSAEMGDVNYERNVINPYNPKIKKKSLIDHRNRVRLINNAFPKREIDESVYENMRKKVRIYLYKNDKFEPFAVKIEKQPKQKVNYVESV